MGGRGSSSGKAEKVKAKTDIDKKAQQIASSYIQRYAKMSDKELDREFTNNLNETRYLKLRLSDLERAEIDSLLLELDFRARACVGGLCVFRLSLQSEAESQAEQTYECDYPFHSTSFLTG